MKVGDYVRTEYGISKIKGIYPQGTLIFIETDNGLGNCSCSEKGKLRKGIAVLKEDYRNFIDNNVKQELIDLIEVGDIVNYEQLNGGVVLNKKEDSIDTWSILPNSLKNDDIKSVITKEQLKNCMYEVGE